MAMSAGVLPLKYPLRFHPKEPNRISFHTLWYIHGNRSILKNECACNFCVWTFLTLQCGMRQERPRDVKIASLRTSTCIPFFVTVRMQWLVYEHVRIGVYRRLKTIRVIGFLCFKELSMVLKSSHIILQKPTSVQTLSPVGQGSPHAEDELPPPLPRASTREWHETENRRNIKEMMDCKIHWFDLDGQQELCAIYSQRCRHLW